VDGAEQKPAATAVRGDPACGFSVSRGLTYVLANGATELRTSRAQGAR
jgi:hypothetical protein